jgi:transposase
VWLACTTASKDLGSRSKKTIHASERNEQARAEFRAEHQQSPINPLFIDEFGSHLSMTPTRARSLKGQRAVEQLPSKRGENVSVVAAMSASGIEVPMMLSGSMDALAFEAWLVQAVMPILVSGMVVFMDNVKFHLGARVKELIESAGCVLAYLPTYSPDLNAIEEAFSKIKEGLRRVKARDFAGLRSGLVGVLKSVSISDVLAYIEHAGYQLIA